MGRHQCPLCWAELPRGPCPKGSCARKTPVPNGLPLPPEMSPRWGVCTGRPCRGLASDAAGSGICSPTAGPSPRPRHAARPQDRHPGRWHGAFPRHGRAAQLRLPALCCWHRPCFVACGAGELCWRACAGPVQCLPGCWARPRRFPSLPCHDCCLAEFVVYLLAEEQRSSGPSRSELNQASPVLAIVLLIKSQPGPLIFRLASAANSIKPSPGTRAIKAKSPADIPLPLLVVLAAACFALWFLP